MPVTVSLALAGALALGAYGGSVFLVLSVALTQGLVLVRWYSAVAAPGAAGGMVLCAAAGVGADLLLLGRHARADLHPLGPVTGVLGLAMVGVLLHQLTRNPRDRVTASMTATAALAVLVVLASAYVAAGQPQAAAGAAGTVAGDLVSVVAAGLAAARLADLLPLGAGPRAGLAMAVAGVVGLGVGVATGIGAGTGLLLGVVTGSVAAAGAALAGRLPHPHPVLSGALPVALAGPVAYVIGRIVLG